MCPNRICNCQKQITFTPRQFELEVKGLKSKLEETFEGTEKAWDTFLKPPVTVAVPLIGMLSQLKQKTLKCVQLLQ